MNSSTNPLWDVVVVGGGPAGSVAAIELAVKGLRVLLVEQRCRQTYKLGESLPPQVRPLVERYLTTSAEHTQQQSSVGCYRSYGNAACWGSDAVHEQDFIYTPNGYGLRLDRPQFDAALRQRARAAGATVSTGVRVCEVECGRTTAQDMSWSLTLETARHEKSVIESRFIIDCSGRSAVLARHLGVKRRSGDQLFAYARCYQQGEGATVDRDTLTRVEAAPDGWWYSARLPSFDEQTCRRLVVFHTDRDLPTANQAATAQGFESLLAHSHLIGPYLREYEYLEEGQGEIRTVRGAAANSERLETFAGAGWLAAGDAAQAFDPLSSQGIGSAVYAGLGAAQTVYDYLKGDDKALARYRAAQEQIHTLYQRQYSHFYTAEQRWPMHCFWRRRHSSEKTLKNSSTLESNIPADTTGKESSCVH